MKIPAVSTMCREAQLTHFRFEIEAREIDRLFADPPSIGDELTEASSRLIIRNHILWSGIEYFETTLERCQTCVLSSTENEVRCPKIATLGFIRDTLTK